MRDGFSAVERSECTAAALRLGKVICVEDYPLRSDDSGSLCHCVSICGLNIVAAGEK